MRVVPDMPRNTLLERVSTATSARRWKGTGAVPQGAPSRNERSSPFCEKRQPLRGGPDEPVRPPSRVSATSERMKVPSSSRATAASSSRPTTAQSS